jgi:hypothetical protein
MPEEWRFNAPTRQIECRAMGAEACRFLGVESA